MGLTPLLNHDWDVTPAAARALQDALRGRVVLRDQLGEVRCVAGVDVGFEQDYAITRAAVVLLSFPGLELLEYAIARRPTSFPYVPGLLSFREIPTVLDALAQLQGRPDLLLCDGQGIAHPRRFGIASHLGVLCDIPAIGVAKSRLVGSHGNLPDQRGAWIPLRDGGEVIGSRAAQPTRRQPAVHLPRSPHQPAHRGPFCPGVHHPLSAAGNDAPGTSPGLGVGLTSSKLQVQGSKLKEFDAPSC
jgi:deoxyribonuclease V